MEYGGVLTYEWHGKMYLGAARGVSGILYVLMQGERGGGARHTGWRRVTGDARAGGGEGGLAALFVYAGHDQ